VSPIIGGRAVKGPTAKIMSELGIPVDITGIAAYYGDIIDGLVIDTQDAAYKAEIEKMGIKVTITNTLMNDLADKIRLAEAVIRFCDQIASANYS
jgi:LPPG:FO 2-phospho-L-lactate transferase